MAYLNPALTGFRAWINAQWPLRDKTSDGWIGDADHQTRISQHNPDEDGSVDAIDVDEDGVDMARIKRVFENHESAYLWIHERQIATRADGWVPKPYTGPNPHDGHGHFETRAAFENSTAPWGDDLDQTQADQLKAVYWTTQMIDDTDGDGRIPLHVWCGRVHARLADIEAKLVAHATGGATATQIVDELLSRLK